MPYNRFNNPGRMFMPAPTQTMGVQPSTGMPSQFQRPVAPQQPMAVPSMGTMPTQAASNPMMGMGLGSLGPNQGYASVMARNPQTDRLMQLRQMIMDRGSQAIGPTGKSPTVGNRPGMSPAFRNRVS